jgi:hypothetical protein
MKDDFACDSSKHRSSTGKIEIKDDLATVFLNIVLLQGQQRLKTILLVVCQNMVLLQGE